MFELIHVNNVLHYSLKINNSRRMVYVHVIFIVTCYNTLCGMLGIVSAGNTLCLAGGFNEQRRDIGINVS